MRGPLRFGVRDGMSLMETDTCSVLAVSTRAANKYKRLLNVLQQIEYLVCVCVYTAYTYCGGVLWRCCVVYVSITAVECAM